MRNLVIDPLFLNPDTYWYAYRGIDIDGVVASAGLYGSSGLKGTCNAPNAAGETVVASAKVSSTGPSLLTLSVVQDGVVLGSVTQASATTEMTDLSVTVTTASDTGMSIIIGPSKANTSGRYDVLKVTAPAVMAPDAPVKPVEPSEDAEADEYEKTLTDMATQLSALTGAANNDMLLAQLAMVYEYIRAYTRGEGFGVGSAANYPSPDLRWVIVGAAARLVNNPEQVSWYAAGDYSERPAVFNGYTLAEQRVLHRYRRRAM